MVDSEMELDVDTYIDEPKKEKEERARL